MGIDLENTNLAPDFQLLGKGNEFHKKGNRILDICTNKVVNCIKKVINC